MNKKYRIPASWDDIFNEIKKRDEKEKEVKESGGDKYQQLKAKLTNLKTGKLMEDIVCYAIRTIDRKSEAKDFLNGYALNIKENPKKYSAKAKQDPLEYAKSDIYCALGHFTVKKTLNLWYKTLDSK
jgi:hypothetical protein